MKPKRLLKNFRLWLKLFNSSRYIHGIHWAFVLNILTLQNVPPATVRHASNIWHADHLSADPELHPEKFSW